MTLPLDGGCLCGAVRYRITAPATSVGVCHCRTCRRAAGAPAVAWASVPSAGFAFTAAAPARFASSAEVERTHCAVCGASLTFQSERGSIDVTLATLDDPEAWAPTHETWLSHRLAWQPVDPARRGFEAGG